MGIKYFEYAKRCRRKKRRSQDYASSLWGTAEGTADLGDLKLMHSAVETVFLPSTSANQLEVLGFFPVPLLSEPLLVSLAGVAASGLVVPLLAAASVLGGVALFSSALAELL